MAAAIQCNFYRSDGARCGSPALRGKRLCYFHARLRPRPRPVMPPAPDPSDPMAVLSWTMYGLMNGALDDKTAGRLIYSAQQLLRR